MFHALFNWVVASAEPCVQAHKWMPKPNKYNLSAHAMCQGPQHTSSWRLIPCAAFSPEYSTTARAVVLPSFLGYLDGGHNLTRESWRLANVTWCLHYSCKTLKRCSRCRIDTANSADGLGVLIDWPALDYYSVAWVALPVLSFWDYCFTGEDCYARQTK